MANFQQTQNETHDSGECHTIKYLNFQPPLLQHSSQYNFWDGSNIRAILCKTLKICMV